MFMGQGIMKRIQILWERIRIFLQFLRINLRTSVIVLIGLSIALSTITSCLIYLETYKAENYLAILAEADNYVIYEHWTKSIQSFDRTDLIVLQESLNTAIQERGLEKLLVKHPLYPMCYSNWGIQFLSPNRDDYLYGIPLNESILDNCVEGSYLPTTMNELILVASSGLNVNIGDWFNITLFYYGDISANYSHSIQITGVITSETLNKTSLYGKYGLLSPRLDNFVLITDFGNYLELIKTIETNFRAKVPTFRFDVNLGFCYNIQVASINQRNVIPLLTRLVSFLKESKEDFYLNNINLMMSEVGRVNALIYQVEEYNSYFLYFLLLCSPALLLTILLIRFSLGLINTQRQRSLGLFKMRGVSSRFLMILLLAEVGILTLIAVLISIILGILGFFLISTTTGFMSFNLASISTIPIFPPLFVPLIILLSICLILWPYIWPTMDLIKSDLPLLNQEFPKTEKEKAVRRLIGKIDIDIFLLLQGFFGIIILIFVLRIIHTSNIDIEEPQIFALLLPLIQILLVVSPLSFLMGFIFSYNRNIPLIIQKLGKLSWKRDWGLLATAIRNFSINIKTTGHFTVLFICTLTFLMILSSLPLSYYQYQIDKGYYETGAEVKLSFSQETSLSTISTIQSQLKSIEGLKVTTISRTGIIVPDINGLAHDILFFGIEENFHEIAHWQDYYDDQSLFTLVKSLFNSSELYPVLLDSNTAHEESISTDDLYCPFLGEPGAIAFSVAGITDYWPGFIHRRSSTYHYIITKRSLIENISQTVQNYYNISGFYSYGDRIWATVVQGHDPELITTQIMNLLNNREFDAKVGIFKSSIKSEKQKLTDQFLWVITNFNFLDSLIVVLIVTILFLLMRVSILTPELGLSRALGMKFKQVYLLQLAELVILLFISGVPGGLIGILFLLLAASVFSPLLVHAPPFILEFNLPGLLFIYSFILIVTILIGNLTSFMVTRTNISEVLKVE